MMSPSVVLGMDTATHGGVAYRVAGSVIHQFKSQKKREKRKKKKKKERARQAERECPRTWLNSSASSRSLSLRFFCASLHQNNNNNNINKKAIRIESRRTTAAQTWGRSLAVFLSLT